MIQGKVKHPRYRQLKKWRWRVLQHDIQRDLAEIVMMPQAAFQAGDLLFEDGGTKVTIENITEDGDCDILISIPVHTYTYELTIPCEEISIHS